MKRCALFLYIAAVPALPVVSRAQPLPEPPPQAPLVVLTDTVEYCDQLRHRVQEHKARPEEAERLFIEGRQMCDHGEVRAGVNRLRRALRILNHHAAPP